MMLLAIDSGNRLALVWFWVHKLMFCGVSCVVVFGVLEMWLLSSKCYKKKRRAIIGETLKLCSFFVHHLRQHYLQSVCRGAFRRRGRGGG